MADDDDLDDDDDNLDDLDDNDGVVDIFTALV